MLDKLMKSKITKELFERNKSMKNPNIIIIKVDQLRQDCLGVYGNKQIKTPNIDSLSKDSTVYHNHYCSYPVCIPSRYSFLTGLPYNTIYDKKNTESNGQLSFNFTTFPSELKKAGYHTKAIGKMHMEPAYHDVGFEEMTLCEQIGQGRWVDDYHRELQEKGLVNMNCLEDQNWEFRQYADEEYWDSFGAKVNCLDEKDASTCWIGDKAIDELDKWDDTNQELLMVSFVNPHHPFDPPKNWAKMYDPNELEPLQGWAENGLLVDNFLNPGYFENRRLTLKKYKKVLAYYYALISEIDFHVGRIVEKLKEKNLYDNTMIIFTTDHGDYMGYHHMILKGNFMYEPIMKIPLIIKYPEKVDCKGAEAIFSINTDIAPTIISVAGLNIPKQMEDASDLSCKDKAGHDHIVSFEKLGERAMVRQGNYKYLYNGDLQNEDHFHWGSLVPSRKGFLFDLSKDPCELNDISDENPEIVQKMKALICKFQGSASFKGAFFANEFNAPIIKTNNALEATKEVYEEKINHFLDEFKKLRGIE